MCLHKSKPCGEAKLTCFKKDQLFKGIEFLKKFEEMSYSPNSY